MENKQEDDDPFESLLNLESDHYNIGFEAGYRDGAAQSAIEARIFGVEKGFEKFLVMGTLRWKAEIWNAKHVDSRSESHAGGNEGSRDQAQEGEETRRGNASANARARLDRHIATLLLLTDSATLDKSNTDDAVATFDDRLKRAQAKVKVIEKILGEDTLSTKANIAPRSVVANGDAGAAAGVAADIENLNLKPG